MFRKPREKSPYFLALMDFGYTLLAAVLVFGYLGYWLDQRWGTVPWLMIAGIGLGLAVGFNSLIRRISVLDGKKKRTATSKKKRDSETGP